MNIAMVSAAPKASDRAYSLSRFTFNQKLLEAAAK